MQSRSNVRGLWVCLATLGALLLLGLFAVVRSRELAAARWAGLQEHLNSWITRVGALPERWGEHELTVLPGESTVGWLREQRRTTLVFSELPPDLAAAWTASGRRYTMRGAHKVAVYVLEQDRDWFATSARLVTRSVDGEMSADFRAWIDGLSLELPR